MGRPLSDDKTTTMRGTPDVERRGEGDPRVLVEKYKVKVRNTPPSYNPKLTVILFGA